MKTKLFKRMNYLRAVTSRSRGITSLHMLRIANSIIRSSLEYGAPLFFDSPPSALNILEVTYNAAIRLASGLPLWTPIQVLRREAVVPSISSRLYLLTKFFILRLLSAPPGLRLGDATRLVIATPNPCWKWWGPLQDLVLTAGCPLSYLTRYSWPPVPGSFKFEVTSSGLGFQDTSLPDAAIAQAWHIWVSSIPPCSLLASDASKDDSKTTIAALDVLSGRTAAGLVPYSNSIFSAEAMAIYLALTTFPMHHPDIYILTDSLSVLKALEAWSFKSPVIILQLLQVIHSHASKDRRIHFIWCPGHRGIPPNETVDSLTRSGPFSGTLFWISPEDCRATAYRDWQEENNYAWLSCDYAKNFPHLLPDRPFSAWIDSRSDDVDFARWRSRTILTCNRLHRMNLTFSPLCTFCYDLDTPEHILLFCPRLHGPRAALFTALNLPPHPSYSDVISAASGSPRNLRHFIHFSHLVRS